MNTLRSIIRMAQANPRWARIAVALDATIGLIVGLVVYFLLNLVEVPASSVFVLLFGAILAIVGIIAVGYLLFVQKFEGVCTQDLGDPVYDDLEEGEDGTSDG